MSIIFFRFFLLYSVVANRSGPKTRYHRACSRSLTSLVLSRSLLRYCTKLCLIGFSAISASFSRNFSGLWAGFGSCFGDFYGFSYFFLLFSGFLAEFGVLFGEFLRFQLHKTRFLCYQPMAIVHYDNLKIQHFLNKKTKKVNFQKK